jgi:hypothetical protein
LGVKRTSRERRGGSRFSKLRPRDTVISKPSRKSDSANDEYKFGGRG